MARVLIRDGYTFEGDVPAQGPWPAIHVRYRPAMPEEVSDYLIADRRTGKAKLDATVKLLAKHVLGWDITDDGHATKPDADTLRRLPYPILEDLVNLVCGYTGTQQEADEKNSPGGSA